MKTTATLITTLISLLATCLIAQDLPEHDSPRIGLRLEWTHFMGGSAGEGVFEQPVSVLDRDGMLYFAGSTCSPDFPVTPDAVQTNFGGIQDAFLVKFDTRRPRVVYSTFLGGAKEEVLWGPCVDRAGNNIIIVGSTGSSDFPTTDDALIKQFQGPDMQHADGFLAILGNDGRDLSYSTFVGGPKIDFGVWRVFVEPSGEVFASGHISSFDFLPTDVIRPKGFKNDPGTYAMKLDAKGQHILSARLMGDVSSGHDVQRLASGDYLIVGNTTNPEFPTTNDAFDRTYHGGTPKWREEGGDIYITRLSADLKTVAFATLLGGAGDEAKPQVATLPSGDFFVLGYTNSKDLPVTADAIEKSLEAKDAVFLARFSGDGRQLKYCTYLDGKSGTTERGKSLVYDGKGRLYAAWITTSPDCTVTPDAAQAKHRGGVDIFLLALNVADNTLAYGSYLGGSNDDPGICLACDENGTLYAIGSTNSGDFPTGTHAAGIRQDQDVFVSKLTPNPTSVNPGR